MHGLYGNEYAVTVTKELSGFLMVQGKKISLYFPRKLQ